MINTIRGEPILKDNPQNITAYESRAKALVQQGRTAEAIAIYEEAIKLQPKAASLYENFAGLLQSQNQLLKAITLYRQALALEPSRVLSLHNLGRLWLHRRDYRAAQECFDKLRVLQPDNTGVYSYCVKTALLQGNLEEAAGYWREVIIRQPEFVHSFSRKVEQIKPQEFIDTVNLSFARFLQAIVNNGSVEEITQGFLETYIYSGDIWTIYSLHHHAEYYYQKALEISPKELELYLRLGKVLERQEKWDAAIVVYHLGLSLNPSHPQINYQLGQLLEKQQQLEPAIKYYEKVLKIQLTGEGKNLKLEPSWQQLPQYPQGIYLSTKDWMGDKGLAQDYLPVRWGEEGIQRKGKEKILPPGGKQYQEKCAGINCLPCLSRIAQEFKPALVAERVYLCQKKEPVQIEQPPTFVAQIPEGRVWVMPYQDSLRMCKETAVITPDNYLLHDLSRDYPWYLAGCKDHNPAVHSLFTLEEMPPVERIEGTVAVFSTLACHNYYHWLLDLLPRIGVLQASGIDLNKIDWFVVNSVAKKFQRETLEILGIPKDKIIESDRHPHLQARKLVVPSLAGHFASPRGFTLQFLRDKFLQTGSRQYPEKIYVSRAKAKYRQVANDTQVIELLSNYGFTTVFLEDFSVREQAALFSQAKVIVAPHGAGLTNLVFCNKGTRVVELSSPNYIRTYYLALGNLLGLNHYYLLGENLNCDLLRNLMYKSTLFEDIFVNLDHLETIIAKIQ